MAPVRVRVRVRVCVRILPSESGAGFSAGFGSGAGSEPESWSDMQLLQRPKLRARYPGNGHKGCLSGYGKFFFFLYYLYFFTGMCAKA